MHSRPTNQRSEDKTDTSQSLQCSGLKKRLRNCYSLDLYGLCNNELQGSLNAFRNTVSEHTWVWDRSWKGKLHLGLEGWRMHMALRGGCRLERSFDGRANSIGVWHDCEWMVNG